MTGNDAELETLVIRVRAETSGFITGVGDIRRELDGPLAQGVDRAGGSIERALARAAVTRKFGFEDLRRVSLTALADIAASAVLTDLGSLFGGSGGSGGGGALGSIASSVAGAVRRRAGPGNRGPVKGGSAYMVGERGLELFVPTASGRIEAGCGRQRGSVNVTLNVAAGRESSPAMMQQTGAQVTLAVRQALIRADA